VCNTKAKTSYLHKKHHKIIRSQNEFFLIKLKGEVYDTTANALLHKMHGGKYQYVEKMCVA